MRAVGSKMIIVWICNSYKGHFGSFHLRGQIAYEALEWEIKSPIGNSKRTIETNFRQAVKQSRYIIFDLRRIKVPEKQCMVQLEKELSARPYVRRLLIIKKNGELRELPQK